MSVSDPRTTTRLSRYLQHRRAWEAGLWIAFFMLQAGFDSIVVNMDFARRHLPVEPWEPVVWEFSSCLMMLAVVPLLLWFEARWPLRPQVWVANLGRHLIGSLVLSLLHVVGMVLLRDLAYWLAGGDYHFGHWPSELLYEYLKDVRAYFLMIALVKLYRLVLLRLQGEASLLDAPDEGPPVEPIERPERFLVRKLGKEFLVAADDIEWLEAEGNYVNLHVKGRLYPLRSTMAAIEPRLDPARFQRVHRSYIVNLDQLAEIEPMDSGDARLRLRDGTQLPCSRTYRPALRARS